jgi:hypothetical protein
VVPRSILFVVLAWYVFCVFGTVAVQLAADELGAESGVTSKPTVIRSWPGVEAFVTDEDRETVDRFRRVHVRTDLRRAVELACGSLSEHMNWDRCRRPPLGDPANRETSTRASGVYPELYWGAERLDDRTGRFGPAARTHALDTGVAHVVGRALWALLLAEETLGVAPPDETLKVLSRYGRDMFDNPDHLPPFFDPGNGFQRFVVCHDLREGFLGLLALARVRRESWAIDKLRLLLTALERATDEEGRLSADKANQAGVQVPLLGTGNDATTSGRLVEPLIEYYLFTGEERALRLAGRFARATLESTFATDGRLREVEHSGGHIHSITSSLCGITRYALLINDQPMLARCRAILDVGVREYSSSWGWVDEVMPRHPANEIGRGEINQTGDVIRTALLLGEAGYPEYYELAERFLRGTLLPVQYLPEDVQRDLNAVAVPEGDWDRDVPSRVVGGYSMFFPNDRLKPGAWPLTTQDIISGAVHALCECWRHRCTVDDDAVRLNLLVDYSGPLVTVTSELPRKGRLTFRMATEKPLLVRVPDWVDPNTLRVTVQGQHVPVDFSRGYVTIAHGAVGREGSLQFALPCRIERESVDGTVYTTTWVGNQVVEILPRGTESPLPF